MHPLKILLDQRHQSELKGIISICTASPMVIEACFDYYKSVKSPLIVEATANQVNQEGGYTGMKPQDYVDFVQKLAEKNQFPLDRLFLGGDHLGPLTWSKLPVEEAMQKAEVLVHDFVLAGFTKIHLDTSMKLADDGEVLLTETIAERGIRLMKVCEAAYLKRKEIYPDALKPDNIIGSEVPIPGGAQEVEEGLEVTKVDDFKHTVEVYQDLMNKAGLGSVFERVLAVVVQPGVEFSDASVHEYNPVKAKSLVQSLSLYPTLVFEGHSTDYQTKFGLKQMVDDNISILKVGPALTFALREGLFALAHIENAWVDSSKQSHFIELLEEIMLENPSNWIKHYHGNEHELGIKRKYSFSDRSRYYMPDHRLEEAIKVLFENTKDVPYSLLSQFLPIQYRKVREGQLAYNPELWVKDVVHELLNDYIYAVEKSQ